MHSKVRLIAATALLMSVIAASVSVSAQEADTYPIAIEEFEEVWARTDYPVAQLVEARTWVWGPGPSSAGVIEDYADADGGTRLVQYFDKSRMELRDHVWHEPDSPWNITQGLLATELMTGRLQLGDDTFEQHFPAQIPVAGDADDTGGPTYVVMGSLMDHGARPVGSVITQVLNREGAITDDPALAGYGVTDAHFDEVTDHNIASVFWDFMNSTGTIYVAGDFVNGDLFENPFYAVGRPRTEAYWGRVKLAGEEQDVLIQCFERRCLTYAPNNPDGWQVESGNIGMHYQEWRYEQIDRDAPAELEVTTFVEGISMPGSMVFTSDGRMFFNEVYGGRIRVVEDGQLLEQPFATLDIAVSEGYTEHGLLGLALDPEFDENGYVYAFYTLGGEGGQPVDQRVVRFTDQSNIGVDQTVIVDGLPFGPVCCHNGGRIAFGPDGMLYVTLGDIEDPATSQNLDSLAGTVLRYTTNGAIPDDNPFGGDSPIYAFGLRNPFGIAFHPDTGDLFVTDNGPDGFDEVNRIVAGGNYGWPNAQGMVGHPDYHDPIWATGQDNRVAPTGIAVPSGSTIPHLAGKVLFCKWNTADLTALELAPDNADIVIAEERLGIDCQLDVAEGPDGAIYTSTSDSIYRYGLPME